MAYVILMVVLAILWGAFFVSWYRSRASQRVDSVARFSRHLSVLERATPGHVTPLRTVAPAERGMHRISSTPDVARPAAGPTASASGITLAEAYRRRRVVLVSLAAAAAVTLVGALLAGGALWLLHLAVDVALVSYLVLLVRAQRLGAERRSKVTYLPSSSVRQPAAHGEAHLVLTSRSAQGG